MEGENIRNRNLLGQYERKYSVDDYAFDQITERSAYWLGFLMADGSINKDTNQVTLALHPRDKKHLNKFRSFLSSTYPIKSRLTQNPLRVIVFQSSHIVEEIEKYGITPNKAKTAKAKKIINNRHFWRGMVDGDGWIGGRDGRPIIGLVGSKFNIELFRKFCKQITSSKQNVHPCNGSFQYTLVGGPAKPAIKRLYRFQVIALDRKYKKVKEVLLRQKPTLSNPIKYYPNIRGETFDKN